MSEELKPCPFCGGKAIIMQHWEDFKTNRYIVKCIKCGAQTDDGVKEHISILWNTRKPIEDITDRINDEMALDEHQLNDAPFLVGHSGQMP